MTVEQALPKKQWIFFGRELKFQGLLWGALIRKKDPKNYGKYDLKLFSFHNENTNSFLI